MLNKSSQGSDEQGKGTSKNLYNIITSVRQITEFANKQYESQSVTQYNNYLIEYLIYTLRK